MPGSIEMADLILAQPRDSEVDEEAIERHAVKIVEFGPRKLTAADALEVWLVLGAPGVGEPGPVNGQPSDSPELSPLPNNAAAPVDDGAEDVEGEGLQACPVHGAHG